MEFKVGQKYRIVDIDAWWSNKIFDENGAFAGGEFENGDIVIINYDYTDRLSFFLVDSSLNSHVIETLTENDKWHDGCIELVDDDSVKVDESNNIKYVQKHQLLKFEQHGDLIDLQFLGFDKIFKCTWTNAYGNSVEFSNDILYYKKGDIFRVKLGFSMQLPEGKMAKTYMRSGTRKNFNVRLTNHVGCIDNNYNGTDDEWMAEFEAIDDGSMEIGDRILQFEIVDVQPKWNFVEVEKLEDDSRGGYGSSGVK